MKPRHIAYIIWIVIALLGVVSSIVPDDGWHIGGWNLRFPTLAEALDMDNKDDELSILNDSLIAQVDTMEVIATVDTTPQRTNKQQVKDAKPQPQATKVDTRTYLAGFYAALDSSCNRPVRVVHYGDSQIEEDRITNILREQWQKQYGGGGVGLIPLPQTIPSRTIRQWLSIDGVVQSAQGGPKRHLVYGPRKMRLNNGDYGVMGQMALMDSTLLAGSEHIVMNIEAIDKQLKPHNYFNRVRILTDSVTGYILAQDSLSPIPHHQSPIAVIDSCERCEIHLQGRGKVYGVSLETDRGLIVDNIPMRGCSGNIFTKMDSTQLSDFYRETNTRLIILQFGGNMIPQTENPATISGYVRSTLRQQVRYIRSCAPEASILFIGPSDMSTNVDGQMTTYPLVPYMDRLLKKMAAEEHIAYWSMYDAMGGKDSMVRWVEVGLAGSDYVHFTRAGANKIGKTLYEWLMSYPPAFKH